MMFYRAVVSKRCRYNFTANCRRIPHCPRLLPGLDDLDLRANAARTRWSGPWPLFANKAALSACACQICLDGCLRVMRSALRVGEKLHGDIKCSLSVQEGLGNEWVKLLEAVVEGTVLDSTPRGRKACSFYNDRCARVKEHWKCVSVCWNGFVHTPRICLSVCVCVCVDYWLLCLRAVMGVIIRIAQPIEHDTSHLDQR